MHQHRHDESDRPISQQAVEVEGADPAATPSPEDTATTEHVSSPTVDAENATRARRPWASMPRRPLCAGQCNVLRAQATLPTDPPVPAEHVPCMLRDFNPVIKSQMRKTFTRWLAEGVPFHAPRDFAILGPGVARSSLTAIVCGLMNDGHTKEDIEQEINIAMAMGHTTIRAARPAIYGWLKTVVPRVMARYLQPVLREMVWLAPTDDENCVVDVADAHAPAEAANDNAGDRGWYRDLLRSSPDAALALSDGERVALEGWLAGKSSSELAGELGITPSGVRVRLMRARRKLEDFATRQVKKAA